MLWLQPFPRSLSNTPLMPNLKAFAYVHFAENCERRCSYGAKRSGFRAFKKEPPRKAGQDSGLHCVQGKRFFSRCRGVGSKDVNCY